MLRLALRKRPCCGISSSSELQSGGTGVVSLFRPTPLLRIPIPPQLLRLVATGVVLFLQAFAMAYNEKAKAAAAEEAQLHATRSQVMDAKEALALLGIPTHLEVPLRSEDDRRVAKKNFERLFKKASDLENLYLQGKMSCAYRVCVDAKWDSDNNSNNNNK
jgi:hypothetical protein